jgi:hypothetical protein
LKTVTRIALGVLATSIALLIVLPGNDPSAQNPEPASAETKNATNPGDSNRAKIDCDRAADRARELIAGRDQGSPEDWALGLLRERGEFDLAFVADAVFHGPADTPAAITVADIKATCRRLNETGSPY